MTPIFILPTGYVTRTVELILSRAAYPTKGWRFYGRDHQGYGVPAREGDGKPIIVFKSRDDARQYARAWELPAYAIWNGRRRAYDGKGAEFIARARDAV